LHFISKNCFIISSIYQESAMARRATIKDIAERAAVSVATVDRVLNGRHPVREETAKAVYEAASALGFHATGLIQQRLTKAMPTYRLGFLLQKPNQPFYQAFGKALTAASAQSPTAQINAQIDYLPSQRPAEVVDHLMKMAEKVQAIAIATIDHPTISEAVAELKERRIPVFALLSDCAPGIRQGYIGLNNRRAGRMAAWVIARTAKKPGPVAICVGSHRFQGHELRETGFRSYFREYAPEFTLLETLVNLEARSIAYEATLDLIQRYPNLAGIYVAGGGMEGTINAIRDEKMANKIVLVCNELTPDSRSALADHIVTAVIGTPLATLSQDLIGLMIKSLGEEADTVPGQSFLPIDFFISENI
jgi:LacI family transcriptional regulator